MPASNVLSPAACCSQDVLEETSLPPRSEVGLPEDKIIYSCSNQLYKYDPETFQSWCNILRRVPDSVLWLLRFPPYGEPRIRTEAAARGIDPDRIIFTDVANKPVHIRRSGLADVFLDTPLCNAHTTGKTLLRLTWPLQHLPRHGAIAAWANHNTAYRQTCAIVCPQKAGKAGLWSVVWGW